MVELILFEGRTGAFLAKGLLVSICLTAGGGVAGVGRWDPVRDREWLNGYPSLRGEFILFEGPAIPPLPRGLRGLLMMPRLTTAG